MLERTPTGMALCIGLNAVDPNHYGGWDGKLVACEADAEAIALIARSCGFSTIDTLLTTGATRWNVERIINRAASELRWGDLFLLYYSGHGGQLPDLNGDEADGQDETWCLYDNEIIDDEIYALLGKFQEGIRIFVLSDSCHSGSVTKVAFHDSIIYSGDDKATYKFLPPGICQRTYYTNQKFYDQILTNPQLKEAKGEIKARTILISGCQDNQYSRDGVFNSLFTGTLLRVWNGGKFSGTYFDFASTIINRMPPDQTPNYFLIGPSNNLFENQKPFTI